MQVTIYSLFKEYKNLNNKRRVILTPEEKTKEAQEAEEYDKKKTLEQYLKYLKYIELDEENIMDTIGEAKLIHFIWWIQWGIGNKTWTQKHNNEI